MAKVVRILHLLGHRFVRFILKFVLYDVNGKPLIIPSKDFKRLSAASPDFQQLYMSLQCLNNTNCDLTTDLQKCVVYSVEL